MKKSVRKVRPASRKAAKRGSSDKRVDPRSLLLRRIEKLEEAVDALLTRQMYADERERVPDAILSALPRAQDRYIPLTSDGWLNVLASGVKTALPSGLKVSLMNSTGGRDYCTVLEGVLIGTTFDVLAGNIKASYTRFSDLTVNVKTRPGGPVIIDPNTKYEREVTIKYKDGGTQKTLGPFLATDATSPIPVGQHDLEIPDFPHLGGLTYGKHATVWCHIKLPGARYMHAGKETDGCLTCDPSKWEEIYPVLHCARAGNNANVGKVVVQ